MRIEHAQNKEEIILSEDMYTGEKIVPKGTKIRVKKKEQKKLNEKEVRFVHLTYETKKLGVEVTFQFDMRNGDVYLYDEMGEEFMGLNDLELENNERIEIDSIINTFSTIALSSRFVSFSAD